MPINYHEFRQLVYDLMMGYCENTDLLPVGNEFSAESRCRVLLEEIYAAAVRLNEQLGTEEHPDTETMIDAFYAMQEHLCKKMFDYGVQFGRTIPLPHEEQK